MKPAMILSIASLALGVLFFVGAVGGLFFDKATPVTDIGLYSVTVVFMALGGFGIWAAKAEADN